MEEDKEWSSRVSLKNERDGAELKCASLAVASDKLELPIQQVLADKTSATFSFLTTSGN